MNLQSYLILHIYTTNVKCSVVNDFNSNFCREIKLYLTKRRNSKHFYYCKTPLDIFYILEDKHWIFVAKNNIYYVQSCTYAVYVHDWQQ